MTVNVRILHTLRPRKAKEGGLKWSQGNCHHSRRGSGLKTQENDIPVGKEERRPLPATTELMGYDWIMFSNPGG